MFAAEGAGLIAGALVVMAASLAGFVAWNAVMDMLRPPWAWADRAALAITQRLGSRLTREEQVRLYGLVHRLIISAGADAQGGTAPR
jgi:hypothetical protein